MQIVVNNRFIIKFLMALAMLNAPLFADYITPGTGVHFTADSLVANAGGAVTGANGSYLVNETVQVQTGDTLTLLPGDTLIFTDTSGSAELHINGTFFAIGTETDSIIITSQNQNHGDFYGLIFRDTDSGSAFEMNYCRIEYAKRAIDVVSADVLVENSVIRRTSQVAIDLFGTNSVFRNCLITENRQRAVTMTVNSSPTIEGCTFTENNFENASPYTIISIGLQGENSPVIRNNHIIGGYDKSGGISIWNSSNALIEGNTIENCGYGILCYQTDANPVIKNNIIRNNTINPDTLVWGFGIASNGPNAPIITGNEIYGHFYGVAIVGGGQPNVGNVDNPDTTDDGNNYFLGNGIGNNRYELFNNNALPILAQNNWWGNADPDSIEDRIVHQVDNSSYGLVSFTPYISEITAVDPVENAVLPDELTLLPAYPNPFNPETRLRFSLTKSADITIQVFDVTGRKINTLLSHKMNAGSYEIRWNATNESGAAVSSGIYFYSIRANAQVKSGKLVLLK